MALYEELVGEKLGLSEVFLDASATVIRERLNRAADDVKRDHANIFAINMCLHAASSIILSNAQNLRGTLKGIKDMDGLKDKDPTTVLTVCVLYYLLQWDAARAAKEKTKEARSYMSDLKRVRRAFAAINWLIGGEAMRVLGLHQLN